MKSLRRVFIFVLIVCFDTVIVMAQAIKPGESITIPVNRIFGEGILPFLETPLPYNDSAVIGTLTIPGDVVNYCFRAIHFNRNQHYFYEYTTKGGRSDSIFYRWYLAQHAYDSLLFLSRKINEEIVIFYGVNVDSSKTIIVDANNNKDLSDDPVIRLPQHMNSELRHANLPIIEVKNIEYPTRDGIVKQNYFLKIDPYDATAYGSVRSDYYYWRLTITVHEYREGFFRVNDKDFRIRFSPTSFNNFYSRKWERFLILPVKDSARNNVSIYRLCLNSDSVTVDGLKFQPLSISLLNDSVTLRFCGLDSATSGIREGLAALNFRVNDLNGETVVLSRVNAGKYVLLDFWGTWCKPCLSGIPELTATYKKLKSTKRFEFISIAYDKGTDYDKMQQIVKENKMDWIHIFEDSRFDHPQLLVNLYKIISFPTGILINPEGKILKIASDAKEMQRLLRTMVDLSAKK